MLSFLFNKRKPKTAEAVRPASMEQVLEEIENKAKKTVEAIKVAEDQAELERHTAITQHLRDFLTEAERPIYNKVRPEKHELRMIGNKRHPAIAGLNRDEANILCRALLRMREERGLRAEVEADPFVSAFNRSLNPPKLTHETRVAMSFEAVLLNLLHTGFSPDAETITPLYHWLADSKFELYRFAVTHDHYKFRLLHEIAKAFPGPDTLPAAAVEPMRAYVKRVLGEAKLSEAQILDLSRTQSHAKAIVTLAGIKPQRLLAQHGARREPRRGDIDPNGGMTAALPEFARYEAAAKAMLKALQDTGGLPGWVRDEATYAAQFGEWAAPGWEFGWWDRAEIPGGKPSKARFDGWRAMPAVEDLPDLTEQLRDALASGVEALDFIFTKETIPDVQTFSFDGQDPEGAFLEHLATATEAKPTAKWRKTVREHIQRIGPALVSKALTRWLEHCKPAKPPHEDYGKLMIAVRAVFGSLGEGSLSAPDQPVTDAQIQRHALLSVTLPHAWRWAGNERDYASRRTYEPKEISAINVQLLTGVFWACAELDNTAPVAQIAQAAKFCFSEMRSRKAGNAALWALGQIEEPEAVWHLARLRRAVARDKSVFKQVDKALEAAGARIGYTLEDMREIAEFDWGIGPDGSRRERVGDCEVTLRIQSQKRVTLESRPWGQNTADPKRGIIKAAIKDDEAKATAKDLKLAVEDIKRALPEVRRRFENAIRNRRSWAYRDFEERFIENNLVAWIARRIIFNLRATHGETVQGIYLDGEWRDRSGVALDIDPSDTRVSVWHPLDTSEANAMDWSDRLAELAIIQPFAQAWRPTYVVTPPERETGTYTNRFAGHILYRPAASAMLKHRGWAPRAGAFRLALPAFGLTAEFIVEGIGRAEAYDQNEYRFGYSHATTDHIRFVSDLAPEDAVPIADVPALAFSEALRDIELTIGATSIGRDAFWQDHGGENIRDAQDRETADAYAHTFRKSGSKELIEKRQCFLALRLPTMAFGEGFRVLDAALEVTGTSGNLYSIHLGSAAVTLNGRHICIVPKGSAEGDGLLPFEGDTILNEVVSKAMLLSQDTQIKDTGIKAQIFGR